MSVDPNAAARPDSGIFGLDDTPESARVVVLPVPWAATTSYGGGAEQGPDAVLAASRQVDLFDVQTGDPWREGIVMLDAPEGTRAAHDEARPLAAQVIEAGGRIAGDAELEAALARVNALSATVNDRVHAAVRAQLEAGKLVVTLGGDHSVPYGAIRAHAERFPGLGVLHVDAHADLRVAFEGFEHSHASIMHNVAKLPGVAKLVQVGIRDVCDEEVQAIRGSNGRIVTHFDVDLADARFQGETWAAQIARIVAELPQRVYLSFDIDGLDPALCPHPGTPVPGGLSFLEANALVAGIARSGRTIVGCDLTEVVPGPDGDEWDGNVGARLLYKMIGWMLVSQRRNG